MKTSKKANTGEKVIEASIKSIKLINKNAGVLMANTPEGKDLLQALIIHIRKIKNPSMNKKVMDLAIQLLKQYDRAMQVGHKSPSEPNTFELE